MPNRLRIRRAKPEKMKPMPRLITLLLRGSQRHPLQAVPQASVFSPCSAFTAATAAAAAAVLSDRRRTRSRSTLGSWARPSMEETFYPSWEAFDPRLWNRAPRRTGSLAAPPDAAPLAQRHF